MNNAKAEIIHFEKLPHIWWGARTKSGQYRYTKRFNLFKRLIKPKHKKLLEIGCGDGEFTKRIVKLPISITAIDVTPGVILRAKSNIKNVSFRVMDTEKLSFKSDSFDVVCGISILHHVNQKKALKEIIRVLKPGGIIFFSEPNLINPQTFVSLRIGFLRKLLEYSPNEKAFVRWQIEKQVKKVGFKNVEVRNYDFLHPLTPYSLVPLIDALGNVIAELPLVKEISGSLIITAKK